MFQRLFNLDEPLSRGDQLVFKAFELFIVVASIQFAWNWGSYIQRIGSVVLPLGIAEYVDVSFMFSNGVSLVNAGLITLFVLLGFFRFQSRWSYGLAMILFHLQYVSRYCLGEISHGSNMVGMGVLALAVGAFFSSNRQYRERFTLGFVRFFIGLAYTSAAVCKLVGTGITWPAGEHLRLWIAERGVDVLSITGNFSLNWIQQPALEHYWFATAVLTFGLLAELFGFLFWWRRTRPFAALALIGMHAGIYVSMNLEFTHFMIELLLVGLPWAAWIDRAISRAPAGFETPRASTTRFL